MQGNASRLNPLLLRVLGRQRGLHGPARRSPARPAAGPGAAGSARGRQQGTAPQQSEQALVKRYCVTCHNARTLTGGLSLEGLDPAAATSHSDVWEKVIVKLRGGMMPPVGMPRPAEATLQGFAASLERRIDAQALTSPDPGHKPIHRLNRTEYGNAVRDLLDLQVDVMDLLPADDESHGFDNIAGVLRVSSSLLEQYLTAARRVSSVAVGTDAEAVRLTFRVPPDDSQQDEVDGLGIGTRGGIRFRHNFPQDAEYSWPSASCATFTATSPAWSSPTASRSRSTVSRYSPPRWAARRTSSPTTGTCRRRPMTFTSA